MNESNKVNVGRIEGLIGFHKRMHIRDRYRRFVLKLDKKRAVRELDQNQN